MTCTLGSQATFLHQTVYQYMLRPIISTNQGAIQDAKIAENFGGDHLISKSVVTNL